jgi:hypothetical protein
MRKAIFVFDAEGAIVVAKIYTTDVYDRAATHVAAYCRGGHNARRDGFLPMKGSSLPTGTSATHFTDGSLTSGLISLQNQSKALERRPRTTKAFGSGSL